MVAMDLLTVMIMIMMMIGVMITIEFVVFFDVRAVLEHTEHVNDN